MANARNQDKGDGDEQTRQARADSNRSAGQTGVGVPRPSNDTATTASADLLGMLILGAHLVWDQGFGEGWTDDNLWGLDESTARDLLFGTVEAVATRCA